MSDLMRLDPLGEMLSLRQAMDRLFQEAFVRPGGFTAASGQGGMGLALDLLEDDENLVVTAGLPGVKPEDIEISVQGDLLTIRGEARAESESGKGQYHRRERSYGSFFRQIQLPVRVQSESAEARFENGVLTLRLPKAEEARERRIAVRSAPGRNASREIPAGPGQGEVEAGAPPRR